MHKLTVVSAVGLCNIIKDLLETNVRQRGNIGGSSVKLGRRIRELERIYDIHNGGNDKVTRSSNGTTGYTESDLANQLGIDLNTLKRAKSLTTLPSEIQDMIEQGRFPFWESACYFRSCRYILQKNNYLKMLKNAIIKRFFGILKFHRMASE